MQNKYILLNVIERNINDPQFFNNIEDAKKELKSQFESLADEMDEGELYSDGLNAYANIKGLNYDWKIYVP